MTTFIIINGLFQKKSVPPVEDIGYPGGGVGIKNIPGYLGGCVPKVRYKNIQGYILNYLGGFDIKISAGISRGLEKISGYPGGESITQKKGKNGYLQ